VSARPHLSIVIPAYNEEARLGPTLDRVLAWLDAEAIAGEVLVVDDGSSDGTCDLVLRRGVDEPRLKLLRNGANRGKGYSVGHGVRQATGERVLFSDADLSTPIEEYHKLEAARLRAGAPIAIGSRAAKDADLQKRQPWYREGMGRGFNLLVQALVFPGVSDTQCGFKLFTADAAKRSFALRKVDGFAFDVEVLFIARRLGFALVEVPIVWVNDEASKVSPIKHSLQMFRDILRIRLLHRGL
jgi:dolichyl-phosphate beta-glucosyltransferase